MYNQDPNQIYYLGEPIESQNRPRRSIYLDSAQNLQADARGKITRVAPAPGLRQNHAFEDRPFGVIYNTMKPMYMLQKFIGISPVDNSSEEGIVRMSPQWMGYSVVVFLLVVGFIGYIRWDGMDMVRSAEGRFEEAVIDYLFTVYLVPIIINPIIWYEARKHANVMTAWNTFEKIYSRIAKKKIGLFLGNRPLFIVLLLPILSCGTMIVTHVTMVHFRILQAIPYCYINTVTYLIGGSWFLQCDVIGKVATIIADDFEVALKNVGPSTRVADYRSLWMMLSKLIQDIGNASAYTITFLCLYLFLIITLTIYGLLSQIQEGLGIKDIGLTITACFAIAMLYFISDEAHYASNCVRVYFQKKLLLVELSWMNEDAQQEINMFLRATEMNPTDMCLGGFFDVNRNLFKSLLATMVTYLVVLLQFQISIPGDSSVNVNNSTEVLTTQSPK